MPHPVDIHVGQRVRSRRWMVGMTQQQLGETVGIKFQQIQKYETGANRVSASRLFDIAAALDTPVDFFFDGIGAATETTQADPAKPGGEKVDAALFTDKEALEFLRHYYQLDAEPRRRLFELARALTGAA